MTCQLIGEQLLHGYDLAQAVEWSVETEPARLVAAALLPLLPALVDDQAAKGVDATYELAVHGGPCVTARFRDAAASIGPPDSGIAAVVSLVIRSPGYYPFTAESVGRSSYGLAGNGDRR